VTGNGPSNVAPTGGASATLSGLNFNSIDLTPTAMFGVSVCSSTSWISPTMLACALVSYGGGTAQIGVTVNNVVGTGLGSLSFDGAHADCLGRPHASEVSCCAFG
jgi:hypothetical protein